MINYIQLRTKDLEQIVKFYERCGLEFKREKHGEGPTHYSTILGTIVIEFYLGSLPDSASFGLNVDDYPEDLVHELVALRGLSVTQMIDKTVMLDPDGRKIVIKHKWYGEKQKRNEFLNGKSFKPREISFVNEPALKPKDKDKNET